MNSTVDCSIMHHGLVSCSCQRSVPSEWLWGACTNPHHHSMLGKFFLSLPGGGFESSELFWVSGTITWGYCGRSSGSFLNCLCFLQVLMTGTVSSFTLNNLSSFFAFHVLLYITFADVFDLFCGWRVYVCIFINLYRHNLIFENSQCKNSRFPMCVFGLWNSCVKH